MQQTFRFMHTNFHFPRSIILPCYEGFFIKLQQYLSIPLPPTAFFHRIEKPVNQCEIICNDQPNVCRTMISGDITKRRTDLDFRPFDSWINIDHNGQYGLSTHSSYNKNGKKNGHFIRRQSMGASDGSVAVRVRRLKREDCLRTKHDSHFSNWKVLVGPSDWKEYSLGKEGAERYRVHNLPPSSGSGPGVYELGIAVPLSPNVSGRDVGKLDQHRIVVVYLGQADNVRSRLQQYGRSGAHLGNGYPTEDTKTGSLARGPGLFGMMFSQGYFMVYRWAPMKCKRDAEETEAQLLKIFDYAWNKGSNGARRPDDILQKLNKVASTNTLFSNISNKLQRFSHKRVGINIKAREPISSEEGSNHFPFGVFKYCSYRPRLVSNISNVDEEPLSTCGVLLNDGTPCKGPPAPGRKRCEEHKGRRIHGSNSKSVTERSSLQVHDVHLISSTPSDQDCKKSCGVRLGDGIFCTRQPVVGRKRCEEHKGMRVTGLTSKLALEDKSHRTATSSNSTSPKSNENVYNKLFTLIYGGIDNNGSSCKKEPAKGNKTLLAA